MQGNSETHFRYRVGHAEGDAALPAGDYTLRIVAKDFSGNEATRGRDLAVRIVDAK